MSKRPRILGEFNSYAGLQEIMRTRADQLQITREQIDEISGLQNGYASKVLAPNPIKKLGATSMPLMLPALGMKLMAVEDPEALKRITRRGLKREVASSQVSAAVQFKLTYRFLRKIAKKGGENSRKFLTRRRRRQLARKAARARWSKPTLVEVTEAASTAPTKRAASSSARQSDQSRLGSPNAAQPGAKRRRARQSRIASRGLSRGVSAPRRA